MGDLPAAAFQQAVIQCLRTSPRVIQFVGPAIYDEPPQQLQPPYLRLGNIDWYPVRTDGGSAWRVLFQIEAHSRPLAGRVEAQRMAEAVIDALDRDEAELVVTGATVSWCEMQTITVDRAPDGRTYLASVTFEAVLDNVP